jgi:hypothetical protein
VSVPTSITSIGASAFFGCSGLPTNTYPSTVTSITDTLLQNC